MGTIADRSCSQLDKSIRSSQRSHLTITLLPSLCIVRVTGWDSSNEACAALLADGRRRRAACPSPDCSGGKTVTALLSSDRPAGSADAPGITGRATGHHAPPQRPPQLLGPLLPLQISYGDFRPRRWASTYLLLPRVSCLGHASPPRAGPDKLWRCTGLQESQTIGNLGVNSLLSARH
jgi:hypothetical protein